jgi:hypothetical protein
MTGTNFSSWYNNVEGSFVVVGDIQSSGVDARIVTVRDSGAGLLLGPRRLSTNGLTILQRSPTNYDITLVGTTFTAGSALRIAHAYSATNSAASERGNAVVTGSAISDVAFDRMEIGNSVSSAYLNGHIRTLVFYPKRLPDSTLKALTR